MPRTSALGGAGTDGAPSTRSKADARDDRTGNVTAEAPRTIFDALATMDRLPRGLRGRGEYESVGHRQLDLGGFEAIPVGETRLAVVHSFLNGRIELGANGLLARGYTGQTTETLDPGGWLGTVAATAGLVPGESDSDRTGEGARGAHAETSDADDSIVGILLQRPDDGFDLPIG